VLGEEHRLDPGPAARTGLSFAFVNPERHRQLVGHPVTDHLLVVVERLAEDVEGAA
jgi:hypothetical protein